MRWRLRGRELDLERRTLVMGIVNVTPDSFSDGGRHLAPAAAAARARELAAEGADLIDLGAESTRPGAEPVAAAEQLRRLLPVLRELSGEPLPPISVDTRSAEVAEAALAAGAAAVNDVSGLGDPRMAEVVAGAGAGLVLMHLRGTPATMQEHARYRDVAAEVRAALAERLAAAERAGIPREAVSLDPGIGFAKTAEQSLELLARIEELAALGRPVTVGVSRKSVLGRILDLPPEQRLEGGIAAGAVVAFLGARVLRTHDVAATARAARVADALRAARRPARTAPA